MLSDEQISQYHSEGYVIARSVIDDSLLDRLRSVVSEMLIEAQGASHVLGIDSIS